LIRRLIQKCDSDFAVSLLGMAAYATLKSDCWFSFRNYCFIFDHLNITVSFLISDNREFQFEIKNADSFSKQDYQNKELN